MAMTIGSVAEAAGVKVATVRYYERRGILEEPPRSPSGYRQYDHGVVDRIRFIRRAQDLGFSLEEIAELLALRTADPATCETVAEATRSKLTSVRSRIRELERLGAVLNRLATACDERKTMNGCPVLEMLDEGIEI